MSAASSAPPSSSVLFARGVLARLNTWETLRIAVQEGWGGAGAVQKRTYLASAIVDAFEETVPTPDDQYVEEMMLQYLADEYDTMVEDGSAEPVAVDIVKMWDATRIGKDELVVKFELKAESLKGKKAVAQEGPKNDDDEWEDEDDEGDDEEDDEMDVDEEVPQLIERKREEPVVDEDGFTLVKGKSKSHR